MDFFEAQDQAKRKTGKLIFYYLLAVIGIILSIYVVTVFLYRWQLAGFSDTSWINPIWLVIVAIIVLITISIGTMFRVAQLRKGGSAVASLLGGRRVESSTTDANERRLMNVVEEMSIASGLPVPDVFVLDSEENINAFAAGFGTNDAAVGVTRGALEQLTRDELQGVIAHEFSHIFNGDMRLNIRLIGILNGILVIHIMGMVLMRSVMHSGGMRSRSSNNGKGSGNITIVIIAMGLSLVVIGYIGMIFGRMIQSAISRQREFLADAAAVQYTRNPDGLAGALNKIGLKAKGAEIKDGHAMEMSHLFFASSFHSALDKLYSTHPPIETRIKAIKPSMNPEDLRRQEKMKQKLQEQHVSAKKVQPSGGIGGHPALSPEVILGAIGTLDGHHIDKAGKLLNDIPESLKKAAHEPLEAEALMFALLFATSQNSHLTIPSWFKETVDQSISEATIKLLSALSESSREWFLPLAEMSLPTLRQLSKEQYESFRSVLEDIIKKSDEENLFAFAIEKLLVRQLDTAFSSRKKPEIRHHHFKSLGHEISVMLSALSYLSDESSESAWNAAIKPIEKHIPANTTLLSKDECTIEKLDKALDELAASANPVKKYILRAIIHCITSDGVVTLEEKELIRAISEALDCPIPMGSLG
jgi:Zn-dependent protease with chaperone function